VRLAVGRAAVAGGVVAVVADLALAGIDDAVAAGLVRPAVGRAARALVVVGALVADLAVDDVDDAVAAALGRLAVRRAAVAGDVVAVVADLALAGVDDAVAAGLVRLAVGRAAAAAGVVGALVADLALRLVDDAVAAALVRRAVGRAAVAVDDVAVVADFAGGGVDAAVAAQGLDADVLVGGARGPGGTDEAIFALHARRLETAADEERSEQRSEKTGAAHFQEPPSNEP